MSSVLNGASPIHIPGSLPWAGYLLGFSLGGFFDGILLHQVLQWHHLLSAITSSPFDDLRVQVFADGLFHILMYLLAAGGLWLLWKARRNFGEPRADRLLLANALIGWGVWHIVDAVLFHWILGLHHIRMDDNWLMWDLLFFAVFGVAFVIAGWILRRGSGSGSGRSAANTAMMLALSVSLAGPIAALPPRNVSTVMVFFKPGTSPADISKAIDAVDGRVLWAASGGVWALDIKDKRKTDALYRHGAWLVSNSALAIGCLAWSTATT